MYVAHTHYARTYTIQTNVLDQFQYMQPVVSSAVHVAPELRVSNDCHLGSA